MTSRIPQPPGVPLLGNIHDIDPSNTWGSLNKLAAKWGPIFKINALGTQIVFICNAALLEEICDERRFRKCVNGPIVEIRQAVHASLFTAYESEDSIWGPAHRIMSPWVSDQSNKTTFNEQRDSISAITNLWTSKPQQVNVTDALKRLNLEVALWTFFHQKHDCMSGPFPEFLTAIDKSTMEAVKRSTRPKLFNWLFDRRGYNEEIHTMRSFCADIIAKRKNEEQPPDDMLNAMLNGKDPETGASLDHEEVIDEIINIFIGSATSPCLVSFALYYLLKQHRDSIPIARIEIDSILGANGELTYENLQEFKGVEEILRETMRLSAVAPGFNIEPRPDVNTGPYVSLAGGRYKIRKNQTLITVLGAVNRDPAIFDDPEAFRPWRMSREAYEKLPSGVKKGFGNGKRQCFGTKYAWQWSMITLITILREVDLELVDKNYTIDGDVNGAFCVQPWNFIAKVEKRNIIEYD